MPSSVAPGPGQPNVAPPQPDTTNVSSADHSDAAKPQRWRNLFGRSGADRQSTGSAEDVEDQKPRLPRWNMGMLNDRDTEEVPGSILLLPTSDHNAPLGLRNQPARTSASSLPQSPFTARSRRNKSRSPAPKKRTPNGQIILDPQPDDSLNDPLNWPARRRDVALISLGLYCMIGGGMTPILAAGFTNISHTYHVTVPRVALTTGLYMMGLGVGSVFAAPTAILFGKRPVYLVGAIVFILTAVWCALSPNYASLVTARVFQGIAVSPVECLPSATIAEIFFLHERAYRIGIYTLLLLGGKNLVPLVSAAVIQSLGWRWVFWIVAMIVGFCFCLLFLFVPETFWDRTPRPHEHKPKKHTGHMNFSGLFHSHHQAETPHADEGEASNFDPDKVAQATSSGAAEPSTQRRNHKASHVGFVEEEKDIADISSSAAAGEQPVNVPEISISSPASQNQPGQDVGYFDHAALDEKGTPMDSEARSSEIERNEYLSANAPLHYTAILQDRPPKSFKQTLRPWNGRLRHDNWLRVAFRPFILFSYPAVLWSTVVYSLSIGWLIVLSESVSTIYRSRDTYNFTALGAGLVYISPFVGGVLGTAVAGKVSDIIVRYMSRRNGGVYEPEFRLVMAIPVAMSTSIGLMGYGWSAQERDKWIVPTVFFGIISFGCSLGSTTAITFCVDSYRQYAGEALVTLNFSKNIFHGLVFSLFFNKWLQSDGSKDVFLALGGIQLGCLLFTIPMYIYGKRARMWTVKNNFMEKF
ncbi:MAG: hypothetical protein M1819_007482 [Sarea resinae]|nr:MAG: hypothetical protein M1819_007482 [Sarea resinae]